MREALSRSFNFLLKFLAQAALKRGVIQPTKQPHRDLGSRKVAADFSGDQRSTERGALPVRQVDSVLSISCNLASCFTDRRDENLLERRVWGGCANAFLRWDWDPKISMIIRSCAEVPIWPWWAGKRNRRMRLTLRFLGKAA